LDKGQQLPPNDCGGREGGLPAWQKNTRQKRRKTAEMKGSQGWGGVGLHELGKGMNSENTLGADTSMVGVIANNPDLSEGIHPVRATAPGAVRWMKGLQHEREGEERQVGRKQKKAYRIQRRSHAQRINRKPAGGRRCARYGPGGPSR